MDSCLVFGCVFSDDNGSSSDDSRSHSDGESSSSHGHDDNNSSMSDNESRSGSHSGSPTPCNSPQSTLVRNSKKNSSLQNQHPGVGNSSAGGGSGQPSSANNSLTKNKASQLQQGQGVIGLPSQQQHQIQQAFSIAAAAKERESPSEQSTLRSTRSSGGASIVTDGSEGKMLLQEKTRFLTLQLQKNSSNLGVCLVGGNVVGIYVHSVQPESIADRAGLRYEN